MVELEVNGERRRIDCDPDTPLLWVLRDHLNLTGTKFGCGIGACGACTVHVDGDAMRTCILPAAAANGRTVTTIEHLGAHGLHPLQRAWIEKQVPQCGYCQSGMLMAAAALLRRHPDPSDDQIAEAMTNLCRCGTYGRVRDAIRLAARSERNPSE
ncbi:(2Fe-2S)-binding protein [Burkholderia lata]|uniref:(2Fe-2S)-binding protein n=1 Tax=Burkholderia lata (strain ATCC 17760 / DSM 23089 / LMG 22485 / NCIMB 9086 / R18194 / 383) TaxID=482957 RepID=UPI0014549672|nr:(2Fe-2S)-binding protein [Burkholderia lata]VWB42673.1 (2Fe-2S)-binding protein [Burkholderia lata]